MSTRLQLCFGKDASFAAEAMQALQNAGIDFRKTPRMRGVSPMDIIIALGSAGAFTALYRVISKLLDKNKDREVTIKRGETEICLKGYSLPETNELLEQFAPELLKKNRPKRNK